MRAPLGKIQFSEEMVVEQPELVTAILGKLQFCPQRVVQVTTGAFEMVGSSPAFNMLPPLARIPGYKLDIEMQEGPFHMKHITNVKVTRDAQVPG